MLIHLSQSLAIKECSSFECGIFYVKSPVNRFLRAFLGVAKEAIFVDDATDYPDPGLY